MGVHITCIRRAELDLEVPHDHPDWDFMRQTEDRDFALCLYEGKIEGIEKRNHTGDEEDNYYVVTNASAAKRWLSGNFFSYRERYNQLIDLTTDGEWVIQL